MGGAGAVGGAGGSITHNSGLKSDIDAGRLILKAPGGPPGLPGWYDRLFAATFPGERTLPFGLTLQELEIGKPNAVGDLRVTPFAMRHADNAGPCLAYRIEVEGKTICYSGDTEWTDTLIEAARGADLFICECYMFEKIVRDEPDLLD